MFLNHMQILNFKASIDSVGDTLDKINSIKGEGEFIQLLNADFIVSETQIIHGVIQAFQAFKRNENLAKDIGVEIVLRCSAQRQISKAFNMLGLKEGEMNLYVVLINSQDYTDELSSIFTLCDAKFSPDFEKIADAYNITPLELENLSLEEIIIDRITKLTVDY